jgi:hypothetical protein
MEQMEPTYIITGNSSTERLIEAIIAYCKYGCQYGHCESLTIHVCLGEEHDECRYHVRPPKEYNLSAALARLSHLRITQLGDDQGPQEITDDASSDDESGLASTRVGNQTEAGRGWEMEDENAGKLAMLRLGCFTDVEAHLSVSLVCIRRMNT